MIVKKTGLTRVVKNILLDRKEPISLVHFVTNRCNARCSFCFIDFDDPKTFSHELTLEEIDKLTKNLGKSLLNVNLTGGEPFARKDLINIAKKYLTNSTIQSIYITTNASLPERIKNFDKVKTFMEIFGQEVKTKPSFSTKKINNLRYDLIKEELDELKVAMESNDLLEVADALTDILYVAYGAGHAFGINLDKCFQEVQSSNMSKLGIDGKPIYNESGKVMKDLNILNLN